MTRRPPRAAGGSGGGGGGGGLPWYLSDLDVEVVSSGSSGGSMGHDRRASPPTTKAPAGAGSDNGGARSSSNNRDNRRRDRPYHFDSNDNDPYVFVPADSSSMAKGGGSGGRSATSKRRHRGHSNVPTASSITITVLLGVLTVFYFAYLRYTSKTVPSGEKSGIGAATKIGEKRSKKSNRRKRLKDKKKKKETAASQKKQNEVPVNTTRRRQQTTAVAVKREEQEERIEKDTGAIATVIVKKEESTTQIVSSEPRTPKRRPASSDQVVHATPARSGVSVAMQLATPKTPQEYKIHVEQIASVVTSTGLDRQQSLQIANETVIRRLETEMSELNVNQREMRREDLEEQRREQDKKEADRRHKESLEAIKGEKRLSDQVIDARIKCREVALQIFPGRHFLLCISVALISMFLCLNFASAIRDVYTDEGNRTILFAVRKVCGCLDDEKNQQKTEGSQLTSYYYSYLRYATDLCPSTLSGYIHVFAPLSHWLGTAPCLAICAIKYGLFFFALGQVHRLLRLFHSIEFVHQAANAVSISALLLSKLVYRSSHHHTSAELLWDLTAPLAVANIILAVLCVAISSSKGLNDKALRRVEDANKEGLEKTLRYLTWLPSLVRAVSTIIAIYIGIYWGTR